jgi:hypothetical protein
METAFDRRSFLGATAAALTQVVLPPRNPDEPSSTSYFIEGPEISNADDEESSCSHAFTRFSLDCHGCRLAILRGEARRHYVFEGEKPYVEYLEQQARDRERTWNIDLERLRTNGR